MDYVPVISALTALVAVIVGPFVALCVTRRQIKAQLDVARKQITAQVDVAGRQITAQVVSANRQVWIDTLRDEITSFVTEYRMALVLHAYSELATKEAARDIVRSFTFSRIKIELLVNPKEEGHAQLIDLLESAITFIANHKSGTTKAKDGMKEMREIVDLSQSILKREWDRVKSGK